MQPQTEAAPPNRPVAPYMGFRVVFAVVNAVIFFVLASVISIPVGMSLGASGGASARQFAVGAMTVSFFACFFGLPGAVGGFLDSARKQRFALPPVEKWGRGLLSSVWIQGAVRGAIAAALVGAIAWALVGDGALSPMKFSLQLGVAASLTAFVQSLVASGPGLLGDLRSSGSATTPARSYFFSRFAVPQGLGNGFITGLIASAVLPDAPPPLMPLPAVIGDAAGTAMVIALFMIFSAGGLARTDRAAGRIAGLDGHAPGIGRRFAIVLLTTAIGAAAGAIVGLLPLPRAAFIAWKFALGTVVGGVTAAIAARHTLREKAST